MRTSSRYCTLLDTKSGFAFASAAVSQLVADTSCFCAIAGRTGVSAAAKATPPMARESEAASAISIFSNMSQDPMRDTTRCCQGSACPGTRALGRVAALVVAPQPCEARLKGRLLITPLLVDPPFKRRDLGLEFLAGL